MPKTNGFSLCIMQCAASVSSYCKTGFFARNFVSGHLTVSYEMKACDTLYGISSGNLNSVIALLAFSIQPFS